MLKKKCSMVLEGKGKTDAGSLPVKLFLPGSFDEEVEVGRELILRGVALPVFSTNLLFDS